MSSFDVGLGVSDLRNACRAFCLHDAIRKVVFLGAEIPGPSNPSPFKFQVGDLVECVDAKFSLSSLLSCGRQYVVASTDGCGFVAINNDCRLHDPSRFKLIHRHGPGESFQFQAGDVVRVVEVLDVFRRAEGDHDLFVRVGLNSLTYRSHHFQLVYRPAKDEKPEVTLGDKEYVAESVSVSDGPIDAAKFAKKERFQKGDVVECVECDLGYCLAIGGNYEVADVKDSGAGGGQIVFLRNAGGGLRGFRDRRFKLVHRPGTHDACTSEGDCCDEVKADGDAWTMLCTGTFSVSSPTGGVADCCEEVKEDDTQEFTIEVGKKYLDRLGRRWLVVWDDGDEGWPLIAVREDNPLEIEWLSEDGRVYGEDNEADEDLVNLCCS